MIRCSAGDLRKKYFEKRKWRLAEMCIIKHCNLAARCQIWVFDLFAILTEAMKTSRENNILYIEWEKEKEKANADGDAGRFSWSVSGQNLFGSNGAWHATTLILRHNHIVIHELKQILKKQKFFDPLFDPLAEWRWALQVVTNATMEPRMQWWEVH